MTLKGFVTQYLGKKIDVDNVYGGQCVDLFRKYVEEVLKLPQPAPVIGARNLWENFNIDKNLYTYYDRIPNTPFGIPKAGDIVLWDANAGGGFGHVAVFLEGNIRGFKSFDQNWPTLDVCTITEHNYKNVYGWIRSKVEDTTEQLEEELKEVKEKLSVAQNHEKFWFDALELLGVPSNSKWKVFKDKIRDFRMQIESLQMRVDKLEEGVVTNVTPLGAQKDGKFIYTFRDMIQEILNRLRR